MAQLTNKQVVAYAKKAEAAIIHLMEAGRKNPDAIKHLNREVLKAAHNECSRLRFQLEPQ